MAFDAVGVCCTGGVAATAGAGAAGTAAKGAGAGATVWAGAATGATAACTGAAARATGVAVLAGRAKLAVRRIVVDLVDLVAVDAGSALDASGSATAAADGSLAIGVAGALSAVGAGGVTDTGATSGATWASKAVEERARTAAIAVIAGRIFVFLWVIILRQRTPNYYGYTHSEGVRLVGHASRTALSHGCQCQLWVESCH